MEGNLWIKALKVYNIGSREWCVPKKGSLGYSAVRKLMENPSSLARVEVKPKAKKEPLGKRVLKKYK